MNRNAGLRCPVCHGKDARVLETRQGPDYVRRRHLCLNPSCLAITRAMRRAGRAHVVTGVRWTSYQFYSHRRGAITVPPDTRAIRSVQSPARS